MRKLVTEENRNVGHSFVEDPRAACRANDTITWRVADVGGAELDADMDTLNSEVQRWTWRVAWHLPKLS